MVDASQGIEAQTLANVYLALENSLEIIPILNKIDLPAADPDRVTEEIKDTIGLDCSNIGKTLLDCEFRALVSLSTNLRQSPHFSTLRHSTCFCQKWNWN